MGVVTSLGAGKADNWKKLTAGKSGIQHITRFPTEGLQDHASPAPSISCRSSRFCSPELSERLADIAAEEAIAESGIGSRGDFPGPLFLAVPPVEIEWPQRREARGARPAPTTTSATTTCCAPRRAGKFDAFHERFLFGSVADHLADKFGTKGSPISLSTACASGATAIQLGVEAIRRGETDAALCIGTDGSVNPESLIRFSLLSALSTAQRSAAAGAPSRSPRTATASSWRKAPARWCWKACEAAKARGAKILGVHRRLRRDGRRLPPHPLEPGRQADHRLHPQRARRRRPRRPTTSTTSIRTAPARRRTTRWKRLGVTAVFGERAKTHADLVQQVDDRPHAVGGGRGRGGVLAADARAPAHPADHQLRGARSRRSRSTWCRTWRATPRCGTSSPIRSASAARTSRW